jgi:gamma-aminobutyric acid receptor subunit beta
MGTVASGLLLFIASVALPAYLAAQDPRQDLERPVNPRSGLPCPTPDQYSRERPDPPGTPTVVGAAMFFQDVTQFNDVDQTVTADIYVLVRWRDARLADSRRGDASAECQLPAGGGAWTPAVEADNLRSRQQFYEPRFLVDARGTVTYARRLLATVASPLDLRNFPFDRHRWRFTLRPVLAKSDELVFHPLQRFVGRSDSLSLQGWYVGQPVASASIESRGGRLGTFARFDETVELRRDWKYYVWKLGFPLTLIVLMAYSVYFIPPTAVAQQIGVGMTSVLTLVAYMLTLGNALPKISYLTRADKFFLGSAVLVFCGLLKGILTTVWVQRENKAFIERADRLGRWLYPVAMLVNFVAAFFL